MMVPTPQGGRVHVNDHPGDEPALVLMHGFPDDSRIYDRLVPRLSPRRVVSFDFLGYGRSDRTEMGAPDRQLELGAVVDALGLDRITLVGHDASGPVAVDYASANPGKLGHLVLLNTYYGHAPMLRLPEMIRLFADEQLSALTDAIVADAGQLLWLLQHTARRFGAADLDPEGIETASIVPQFFGDANQPDALAAIRAWTRTLFAQLDEQDRRIAAGALAAMETPVTLAFGERDEYLGPALARHLGQLFAQSEVHVVEGASHWPQWDRPDTTAALVLGSSC
jgi:haloalkane dehalogenase